jgi:hypothetical protein
LTGRKAIGPDGVDLRGIQGLIVNEDVVDGATEKLSAARLRPISKIDWDVPSKAVDTVIPALFPT